MLFFNNHCFGVSDVSTLWSMLKGCILEYKILRKRKAEVTLVGRLPSILVTNKVSGQSSLIKNKIVQILGMWRATWSPPPRSITPRSIVLSGGNIWLSKLFIEFFWYHIYTIIFSGLQVRGFKPFNIIIFSSYFLNHITSISAMISL